MIPKNVRTFGAFINATARIYNKNIAVKIRPRFRAVSWTYNDLLMNSIHVAGVLEKHKIKRGDKVLLWAPNSHLWVAAFFGIQLKGAIVIPISMQNTANFINKIVKQTDAKVIIKSIRFPKIRNIKNIDIEGIIFEPIPKFTPVKTNENDLAEIIYTSGTTGDPKGVMLTHKNILSNVKSASKVIIVKQDDHFLSILPLSHMFEQTAGMLLPLANGCQITYTTSLNSISIRKNLIDDKITKMVAVPEFLKLVMRRIEHEAESQSKRQQLETFLKLASILPMGFRRIIFKSLIKKFGKLDTIASGGAPLDKEIGQKWENIGIYILQGYGTTETSPVVSANGYQNRKVESVGKVIEGVNVKLSEDNEIFVNGPNVTQGYYKDLEKTTESFSDGWYMTGDIGHFDEDGHLYIRGRTKYMIVRESGENVHPEDLEFELNKIPEVEDSCVVGLENNGNIEIHAVLLGKKIKNPEKIIENVNKKLPSYQQIQSHSIWPFDDFPRTVTRKIKKDEVISYFKSSSSTEIGRKQNKKVSYVEKIISQISGAGIGNISDNKKLVADLKMDSLQRVELVSQIEEETGILIDESDIGFNTTVRDIKKKIAKKKQKIEKYEFNEYPLSNTVMFLRKLINTILWYPLISLYAPHKIEGLENLRNLKTPMIFFPNHIGNFDAPILLRALPTGIREKVAFATAIDATHERYTWAIPLLNFFFNIYPFARSGQIKSSLEYTGRLIDRGFSVVIFPEGKISRTGKLQKIKEGAGFLAIEMGIPIIPVKLIDANYVYPLHRRIPALPTRHDIKIKFGKPITFPSNMSYIDATKIIEDAIRKL